MTRGEAPAPRRSPRLKKHRCTLGRWFAHVHTFDAIVRPRMGDGTHPRGIGVDAPQRVPQHGPLLPGLLPELADHLHIFVGHIIALVVGADGLASRGARARFHKASDDIPSDAPLGQMIKGGKPPCQNEWMLIGEVGGDAEAQMFRGVGHGGNRQRGIIHGRHGASAQRLARPPAIAIHQANGIGEENTVQQAAFGQLRQLDVILDVRIGQAAIGRMRPHARPRLARRTHVKSVQPDLPARFRHGVPQTLHDWPFA